MKKLTIIIGLLLVCFYTNSYSQKYIKILSKSETINENGETAKILNLYPNEVYEFVDSTDHKGYIKFNNESHRFKNVSGIFEPFTKISKTEIPAKLYKNDNNELVIIMNATKSKVKFFVYEDNENNLNKNDGKKDTIIIKAENVQITFDGYLTQYKTVADLPLFEEASALKYITNTKLDSIINESQNLKKTKAELDVALKDFSLIDEQKARVEKYSIGDSFKIDNRIFYGLGQLALLALFAGVLFWSLKTPNKKIIEVERNLEKQNSKIDKIIAHFNINLEGNPSNNIISYQIKDDKIKDFIKNIQNFNEYVESTIEKKIKDFKGNLHSQNSNFIEIFEKIDNKYNSKKQLKPEFPVLLARINDIQNDQSWSKPIVDILEEIENNNNPVNRLKLKLKNAGLLDELSNQLIRIQELAFIHKFSNNTNSSNNHNHFEPLVKDFRSKTEYYFGIKCSFIPLFGSKKDTDRIDNIKAYSVNDRKFSELYNGLSEKNSFKEGEIIEIIQYGFTSDFSSPTSTEYIHK